jgi:chemotaxis protein MotA
MNIASIVGLFLSTAVLFIGLSLATDNLQIFLDFPSMFIVLGGTFSAIAISFQIDRVIVLFKIFLEHITGAKKVDYAGLITEIMKVGDAYRRGESLEAHMNKTEDYFLKEALEIVNDGVLEHDHIIKVLEDRADNMNYMAIEDANKFKILGKFPPAFGMMGTTIGMIVLLANLGGEDALKRIGPAMGVCLITTLYGVAIANLIFIPISENLVEAGKLKHLKNLIIIEGIKQLLNKSNPVIVAEELNSYLPPRNRLDWKEILGKG